MAASPVRGTHGCIAAVLLLAGGAAGAQENIIVTASRTESGEVAISTLGRDEVLRGQPVTALEPLDRLAGVRAFSKGGLSYLSVRGGDPNFTLVLIDGVRVNDPTNSRGGAFDFEQIDPAAIERIEVARSALSAVHGADALSGVVHLRLRSPRPDESFASARATTDSRGSAGVGATAARGWSSGGLLASAGWFDSGSLHEGVDLDRRQGLARLRQEAGGAALSALVLHARSERIAFPEDSGGPRLAVIRDRETRDSRLTIASAELTRAGDHALRPRLAINWSRQDSGVDTPPIAPGILPGVPGIAADTRFDRFEALADVRFRVSEALNIAAGTGVMSETGRSDGFIDVGFPLPADFLIERTLRSLFAEATVERGAATFIGGLRYDHSSDAGGELTGRAGIRLAVGAGSTVFADYSEGYKLPSLFALAYPLIANPLLEPERGRTLSVGVDHDFGAAQLRVALFESRFANLIDFDVERFTNVNRANVRSRGVEAEGSLAIGDSLAARGALTYMDVDNDPGAPPLRSRPKWEGAAALDWRAGDRLTFSLGGRFNSAFYDSSIPTGLIVQDGHVELDATAAWRLNDRFLVRLTGRNLSSADYENSVGFPAGGTAVRIGLETRL